MIYATIQFCSYKDSSSHDLVSTLFELIFTLYQSWLDLRQNLMYNSELNLAIKTPFGTKIII